MQLNRTAGPASLVFLFCAALQCTSTPSSGYSVEEYRSALDLTSRTATVRPGSADEKAAADRFRSLYANFTEAGMRASAKTVYAQDAYFNDTIKTVRGAAAIGEYLAHGASNVYRVQVDMQDLSRSGRDYYFRWIMSIQLKEDDEPIRSMGISHVRFNGAGRVVLHQDYWDSAAGLFDHLPGTGFFLRFYRKRL